MSHTSQPSLDDTTKKTATTGSVDEPDKLQGYASAPGVVDEVTRVVDHKAERRLCRRFDIRLLPILAVMCMTIRAEWLKTLEIYDENLLTNSSTFQSFYRPLQCPR